MTAAHSQSRGAAGSRTANHRRASAGGNDVKVVAVGLSDLKTVAGERNRRASFQEKRGLGQLLERVTGRHTVSSQHAPRPRRHGLKCNSQDHSARKTRTRRRGTVAHLLRTGVLQIGPVAYLTGTEPVAG